MADREQLTAPTCIVRVQGRSARRSPRPTRAGRGLCVTRSIPRGGKGVKTIGSRAGSHTTQNNIPQRVPKHPRSSPGSKVHLISARAKAVHKVHIDASRQHDRDARSHVHIHAFARAQSACPVHTRPTLGSCVARAHILRFTVPHHTPTTSDARQTTNLAARQPKRRSWRHPLPRTRRALEAHGSGPPGPSTAALAPLVDSISSIGSPRPLETPATKERQQLIRSGEWAQAPNTIQRAPI